MEPTDVLFLVGGIPFEEEESLKSFIRNFTLALPVGPFATQVPLLINLVVQLFENFNIVKSLLKTF